MAQGGQQYQEMIINYNGNNDFIRCLFVQESFSEEAVLLTFPVEFLTFCSTMELLLYREKTQAGLKDGEHKIGLCSVKLHVNKTWQSTGHL